MNKKQKEKKIIKRKIKKKEITKSYFTLDSVKHSLHIFYFGTRFTLAMQLLQEFNLFQILKEVYSISLQRSNNCQTISFTALESFKITA